MAMQNWPAFATLPSEAQSMFPSPLGISAFAGDTLGPAQVREMRKAI
jgi:hypothetical protein